METFKVSPALRRWCGSFLFTPVRPFFFSSPLSSCLTRHGEFKNNWASGLNLNPAISAVLPPCVLLRPSPSDSVLSRPRRPLALFFHQAIKPSHHGLSRPHKSRVSSVSRGWHSSEILKWDVSVSVQVRSAQRLFWAFFLIVWWSVSRRPLCYFWTTITAAFRHLPQETGQLRPAVSFQSDTV